ncbi:tRNA(Ile)-lysidine synthase [Marinomonas aquimarina]|uniref:tRNA(Ile)-lysidine synthase n=1 Tax=Marinomonas aquimarina TaxID=295068 RepID=A0A1A8SYU0_9GAMM|nr:tRNA lysidine(34) synthetase TilS [Marinomonas aquimarina]SBS24580.1 tRNA(Ile)-lysidine synthase [Marinomonas aquimarina]
MIGIDWQRLESLLGEQGKVWLALSGGMDSIVLLHLLRYQAPASIYQRLAALHVHHGLSVNADQWLRHCQAVCQEWDVPFYCERVQIDQTASIEDQARQKRYQVFASYLAAGDVLLQGHHANDQAETLLFRLERGCGWRGIQGIPEARALGLANIYRPLLKTSRAEIEAYAQRHQLNWLEDESNQDVHFRRNFLRHQVIAPWQKNTANIAKQIAQSAERIQAESRVLGRLVEEALASYIHADGGLLLSGLPESERGFWLSAFLNQQGISLTQQQQTALVEMFFSAQDKQPEYRSQGYRLVRFKEVLYRLPQVPPVMEQCVSAGVWLERAFDRIWCDQEVVVKSRPENTQLRLSNGKHRWLKKWLQGQQVPSWWREQLPYLYAEGELVAIGDLWQHPDWPGQIRWQRNTQLPWPSSQTVK